jgi:hypothetical protein
VHLGCSIGLAGERVVPVTECWMALAVFRRNHRRDAAICFRYQSLDAGLAERRRGRHTGSPEQALSHS